MKKEKFISIVISTLNCVENLKATLSSFRNRIYSLAEIVIVDGGSADGTVDIIKQADPNVTCFVSEPDTGIYDAWNKGLRLCKGDYIAFLGAGDSFVEGGLEKLVEVAIKNHTADIISSKVSIIEGKAVKRVVGKPWRWSSFRRHMTIAHPGALHSRRLFDKYGEFDKSFRIAGDYEFLLRPRDRLLAMFVDEVTVRMLAGGASQRDLSIFLETEVAKIKNHAVPPWLARFDRRMAQTKWFIRNRLLD